MRYAFGTVAPTARPTCTGNQVVVDERPSQSIVATDAHNRVAAFAIGRNAVRPHLRQCAQHRVDHSETSDATRAARGRELRIHDAGLGRTYSDRAEVAGRTGYGGVHR